MLPVPSPPFKYALKISKRARRARLAVKPFVGLEVVIPYRFPRSEIPRILQQHADWITKQLQRHANSFQTPALPRSLNLLCFDRNIQIDYEQSQRPGIEDCQSRLLVRHRDSETAIRLLRRWVRCEAKTRLVPLLKEVNEEFGFIYRGVNVRSQKTRWGSCSASGTINLNDQLLFLPKTSVRYLMIHELCHTQHLNHSNAFWTLVSECCPGFKQHEKVLDSGQQYVPDWFLHDLFS